MLGVPQTRELGRDEGKCIAGYARICERKTKAGKRKKMGVPSHGEGKPKARETALQKDETSLELGAVARRRTCQADGSSGEFCQGWQLANEKKRFFWSGTRSDRLVFRLLHLRSRVGGESMVYKWIHNPPFLFFRSHLLPPLLARNSVFIVSRGDVRIIR